MGGIAQELEKGEDELRAKIISYGEVKENEENTEDETEKGFCGVA